MYDEWRIGWSVTYVTGLNLKRLRFVFKNDVYIAVKEMCV